MSSRATTATQGTDWCFDIAMRVAPGNPEAWDLTTVAGAAFARYVREASDYAGGARVVRRIDRHERARWASTERLIADRGCQRDPVAPLR